MPVAENLEADYDRVFWPVKPLWNEPVRLMKIVQRVKCMVAAIEEHGSIRLTFKLAVLCKPLGSVSRRIGSNVFVYMDPY